MNVDTFCELPFQHLKINCEGKVAMCCDQPRGLLGNVLETPVLDIWNSKLSKQIRAYTADMKLHPKCKKMYCPYQYYQHLCDPEPNKTARYHDHPISIELDLPNFHCNIGGKRPNGRYPACLMCCRSSKGFRAETDRLQEVCEAIHTLLANLEMLHIQGVAEPFYKGKVFDVLDWLRYDQHKNVHLSVSTITNGTLMNAETRKRWFSSCSPSRVFFSMDAGSQVIYKKIRRLDLYDVVRGNLIAFGKERDPSIHGLRINNNINTVNVGDCVAMVEDAAAAGVDLLSFSPTDPTPDIPDILVNRRNCHLFEDAQNKIENRARELGVTVQFRKPLHLNMRKEIRFL